MNSGDKRKESVHGLAEYCDMKAADTVEVVMWEAWAHVGEYLDDSNELPLLSFRAGSQGWHACEGAPSDDASKCLTCLFADLKSMSRTPVLTHSTACLERFMTVFVKRILGANDAREQIVARFDIVSELSCASAGVLRVTVPREDVGPVSCLPGDDVWDIMLKLLSAMYARI